MAKSRERRERRRAGSNKRDQVIRSGGSTTINVPDGMELFIPKQKIYRLDVLLYEVGDGNPCADPGDWYYERTFFAHTNIGPDGQYKVCPAKTVGKPCPICEDAVRLRRDPDADKDLVKSLKPSQRQLWLLHDREDDDDVIHLLEFSWWNFGRHVDEGRKDADEDETHKTDFDDPKAGACLRVSFKENPPYGMEARSIEFKPRPNGIPDSLMEHGVCLDDLLIIPTYEELRKLYYQEEDEGEDTETETETEPEEKPKKSTRKKVVATAESAGMEEGMMVEYRNAKCEILRISKDGTSLTLQGEDDDGETYKGVGVDEVKILEKKPEEKPKPKAKGKPKAPPNREVREGSTKPKPVPEPDADDDDWDDDMDDDKEEEKPESKDKTEDDDEWE